MYPLGKLETLVKVWIIKPARQRENRGRNKVIFRKKEKRQILIRKVKRNNRVGKE